MLLQGGRAGRRGERAGWPACAWLRCDTTPQVLEQLTGQTPVYGKARFTVRSFAIRRNEKISVFVTVRGDKAMQLLVGVQLCHGWRGGRQGLAAAAAAVGVQRTPLRWAARGASYGPGRRQPTARTALWDGRGSCVGLGCCGGSRSRRVRSSCVGAAATAGHSVGVRWPRARTKQRCRGCPGCGSPMARVPPLGWQFGARDSAG